MFKSKFIVALAAAIAFSAGAVYAGDCGGKEMAGGCSGDKSSACTKDAAKGGAEDAGKDAKSCGGKDSAKCGTKCEMTAQGGAEDPGKGTAEGYKLGEKLPAIELPNVLTGEKTPLFDNKAAATVIVFWNQTCPYVEAAVDAVSTYAKEAAAKNVRVVAIDAGVNNKEEDIKKHADGRPFTVLTDRTGMTAVNFGATRTPEVFVLDKGGVIRYHGAFNGGDKEPNKTFTATAVSELLEGKQVSTATTKAFGCTIKLAPEAAKTAKEKRASQKTADAGKSEKKEG